MKDTLKHIGLFFLVSMLLVKVSAFHVFEHHDVEDAMADQCELCVLAIDNQQTEITTFLVLGFTEPYSPGDSEQGIFFSSVQIPKTMLEFHHCSRPPPSYI